MIRENIKIDEIMSTIESQGFSLLHADAQDEIHKLILDLRSSLDPRVAGKVEGIEWALETLPDRYREQKKEVK